MIHPDRQTQFWLQSHCFYNTYSWGHHLSLWWKVYYSMWIWKTQDLSLTLMVASCDSLISSFFICKNKNMTLLSELLWNHDKNVNGVTIVPGLGHILEECASPRPFPTTLGTFWAAGILVWSWISVFPIPHLIQAGWVGTICFQNFCQCYEGRWFKSCVFSPIRKKWQFPKLL